MDGQRPDGAVKGVVAAGGLSCAIETVRESWELKGPLLIEDAGKVRS